MTTMWSQSDVDQIRIDQVGRSLPASVTKRQVAATLGSLRASVALTVKNLVDGVAGGKFGTHRAAAHAAATFDAGLLGAFKLGLLVAGVPENSKWKLTAGQAAGLREAKARHLEHFRAFVSGEAMSTAQRANLYGGMIEESFWQAWVSMLPTGSKIEWVRTIAESCEGCIKLARGSPYTLPGTGKRALPAVPRGGSTVCLANCRCYLVARGPITSTLQNLIGVEIVALGAIAVDPTSPVNVASAGTYQALADLYAYSLRVAAAGGDSYAEPKAVWDELAALARSLGQSVRMAPTQGELTDPIRSAERIGLKYVSMIDDTLLGVMVGVIVDDEADRGRVTAVSPGMVILDGDPSRVYRTGAHGRALVFRE